MNKDKLVDEIIHNHEIWLKSLESVFGKVEGVAIDILYTKGFLRDLKRIKENDEIQT